MAKVLLCVLLLACSNKQQQQQPANDPKASDLAKLTVKKLAYEAYPQWAMKHPDKACPDTMAELTAEVQLASDKDPWGNAYRLYCGASLPAGAKGIGVMSLGVDGKEATADDIKSWE